MALAEADKDCDEAMRLDPKFAKGYIRKASVELAKRDFMKALDWLKEAKEKDAEGKSATEIDQLVCYFFNKKLRYCF
jgi:stress-induced-phosphoprotein 1